MVCCGLLLGASKAVEYLANPFFQLKMTLLVGIGLHGLYFRRRVYRVGRNSIRPTTARAAAVLSLILWVGVVSMGRWIAYYDPPSPARLEPTQSRSSLAAP
jgi:hypothetical protein